MSPVQSQASTDASGATPARILVVEDERIVARDLASALTELGYSVPATVATGEDAIARARDLQPDVVLMDIRLPGAIDGIQAASSVRQEHDIPVIYLTAHSDDETLRRAMQTEPLGYLVKPFSPPQLRCAIEIALHRREINARLRERQQWLATTLQRRDDGVDDEDAGPRISYLNLVAEAVAGWRLGEDELEKRLTAHIADLEAANRELENFTYGVARDLRGPLRGIDGLSQSLIEDHAANLGPEGLKTLRQVRETAGRMRQVIDNLLLLSIDDLLLLSQVAKTEPRKSSIDLSRIALDVVAQLRQSAPEREVKAVIERNVRVDGDPSLLRIVLENLLGNAWKFTGEVDHARIEFGAFNRDGAQVCFVRDNGSGFDMNDVHKLFVAFQSLDSADQFEGNGLGLAIAHRAINRHGGRIWAEGASGRGATFYFSL
ncbi:MAG TPA: response regulator [Burkholderiaceae bacterium]|jgi:signal transduction histidine kinase|nr:response regulator [Burkholderiaceae bacterium]